MIGLVRVWVVSPLLLLLTLVALEGNFGEEGQTYHGASTALRHCHVHLWKCRIWSLQTSVECIKDHLHHNYIS